MITLKEAMRGKNLNVHCMLYSCQQIYRKERRYKLKFKEVMVYSLYVLLGSVIQFLIIAQ